MTPSDNELHNKVAIVYGAVLDEQPDAVVESINHASTNSR
jgi:hypothetical protein